MEIHKITIISLNFKKKKKRKEKKIKKRNTLVAGLHRLVVATPSLERVGGR
jgi:hypothetical protein